MENLQNLKINYSNNRIYFEGQGDQAFNMHITNFYFLKHQKHWVSKADCMYVVCNEKSNDAHLFKEIIILMV